MTSTGTDEPQKARSERRTGTMGRLRAVHHEVLSVLPVSARRFLTFFSMASGGLAILDAVALALLALVMGPMASNRPWDVPLLGIQVSGSGYFVALGVVCAIMLLKGVLAVGLQWIATRRFARYELAMGDRLLDSYLRSPWVERLKRNSADLIRIADVGIANTIAGLVLPLSTLLGESMTFVSILLVLALTNPLIAIVSVVYLGLVAGLLYVVVSKQSVIAGRVNRDYSFIVARMLTEMVAALKEITLRDKAVEVAEVVHDNRIHTSRARANIQFLNQVPRYVLESALIGGFALVGLVGYLAGGIPQAVTAVAVFGVAGFRLAPSLTRFQNVISTATSNSAFAEIVVADIRSIEGSAQFSMMTGDTPLSPSAGTLELDHVGFAYQTGEAALRDVSLSIPFGSTVAFVGSSGAGKSTMVDLILGLITPTSGSVSIDGVPLAEVARDWRSRVGYVPQDVSLFDATVAQNVALTWTSDFDEERVKDALGQAQLLDVIEQRPRGVRSRIGERGMSLSGGQRQRLGIARALYPKPMVLVLDEATSALDTTTEAAISDAIRQMHGKVTVVLVAHRLATIRHADSIYFLRDGKVVANGTFDELVAAVPDFAHQAALAGLVGDASAIGLTSSGSAG